MESNLTNPVDTLRRRATCLEAAVSVSVAQATRKAVHELRSETRRIEAQLDLLQHVTRLASYRSAAEPLRRRLRKLRRLAGEVRDCDVQRKLLKKDEDTALPGENADELRHGRKRLRRALGHDRQSAEARLSRLLRRQQPKLVRNMETVLETLKPSEEKRFDDQELLSVVERAIARSMRFRGLDEQRLHGLRKAAKKARYQCEMLPGMRAASFAAELEALQDAGGAWHDFLVLAERAAKELGTDHALARALEREREARLTSYLEKLDKFRQAHASMRTKASSKPRPQAAARKRTVLAKGGRRPPQRETGNTRADGLPKSAHKMTA